MPPKGGRWIGLISVVRVYNIENNRWFRIPMIDLTNIKPHGDSLDKAFEELVCLIAKRLPPPKADVYKRIEGSGGDGGTESYWELKDGSKVLYQAKYFTKNSEIKWSQMQDSFEKALKSYSNIKEYIFAIACDFTDVTPKGDGGYTNWIKIKNELEGIAKSKGEQVEVKALLLSIDSFPSWV